MLVLGLGACTHAAPPSDDDGEPHRREAEPSRPAPPVEREVEVEVRAPGFEGPPARLACPPTVEHGCSMIARIPRGGGEAEPFLVESALYRTNGLDVSPSHVIHASQVSGATLIAYPLDLADARARRDAMRLLDTSGDRIRRIAVGGRQVAVALETGVVVAPIDASGRTELSATTHAYTVATDGVSVVWTESHGAGQTGRILRAPIAGGPVDVVAERERSPADVAIDAGGVYWLDWGNGYYDPLGGVRMLEAGATAPRTVAAEQRAPRVLTTDADAIYWVLDGPEGRTLRAVAKRGGEVRELVPRTGREGVRSNRDEVRVLGGRAYFNAGDAVWEVGVDGSSPVIVARVDGEDDDVVSFAVDETSVYVAARIGDPHDHRPTEP